MYSLIRTSLEGELRADTLIDLYDSVLETDLTVEERELLSDIKFQLAVGNRPTFEALSVRFPFLKWNYDGAVCYDSVESLVTDLLSFIRSKKNIKVADELSKMSEKIVKHNVVSSEDFESIRELYRSVDYSVKRDPEGCLESVKAEYLVDCERGKDAFIYSYIDEVDRVVGGFESGSLATIFAFVASFKTTMALNIAYRNYMNGKNVVFLSKEVPIKSLLFNILSMHSVVSGKGKSVEHEDIRKYRLNKEDSDYVWEVLFPDLFTDGRGKLYLLDETYFNTWSPLEIEETLLGIDRKSKIDLVIVDYLQLFKFDYFSKKVYDIKEVMNSYVSFFRRMAISFNGRPLNVILLSQANREGWKRAVKNQGCYDLTAISEVNELERSSYYVLSIFTDDALKLSKEAKVQILKNRSGMVSEPFLVRTDVEHYLFGDSLVGTGGSADAGSFDSLDLDAIFKI